MQLLSQTGKVSNSAVADNPRYKFLLDCSTFNMIQEKKIGAFLRGLDSVACSRGSPGSVVTILGRRLPYSRGLIFRRLTSTIVDLPHR